MGRIKSVTQTFPEEVMRRVIQGQMQRVTSTGTQAFHTEPPKVFLVPVGVTRMIHVCGHNPIEAEQVHIPLAPRWLRWCGLGWLWRRRKWRQEMAKEVDWRHNRKTVELERYAYGNVMGNAGYCPDCNSFFYSMSGEAT